MRSCEIAVGPAPTDRRPYAKRSRQRHTHGGGGSPCEGRGSHWSEAATKQGPPRVASNHQQLEEAWTDSLMGTPEGTNSADTSIPDSDFRNSERISFGVICYRSPKKPIQIVKLMGESLSRNRIFA